MSKRMLSAALSLVFAGMVTATSPMAAETGKREALVIQEQGSFAVGGTVIKNAGTFDPYKPSPAGQTFHGDHAYVSYQIPVNPRKLPLVLWHGARRTILEDMGNHAGRA
jgi:hypothetical protein